MKHFSKMAFYLLSIICIFGISSCEKELYEDSIIIQKLKIKKVEEFYFKDLKLNKKFNLSLNKVLKSKDQKSNLNRTVLEDEYNFTIVNTVPIKIITNEDGSTYYNILIERATSENLKFENLIIKEQYEEVEAFIIKYTLSTLGEKNLNHDSFNLDIINTEIKNLEIEGRLAAPCHSTMTIYCDDVGADDGTWTHNHIAGAECFAHSNNLYMVTETICDFGGGGDGDGSGLNPSGNGMGNNVPAGGNAPLLPIPSNSSVRPNTPCEKIKKQFEKFSALKQSLVTLASTTSQNHENGIFIDSTANATSTTPIQQITSTTTTGGTIALNMSPINQYVMIAHTHDAPGSTGNGTYSIFSWDDLTTMNNLIKNDHINTNNFVFYVLTADGTRYAITIDDPTALSDFFYDPTDVPFGGMLDLEKFKFLDLMFKKYYDKQKNGTIKIDTDKDEDKKKFLNFVKEAKLGISLFEIDSTFSTFEKLSINSSGVISKSICK